MTALYPFVRAYDLPLNPEDLEEMVYAVLKHATELGPSEQITKAVQQQIASAGAAQEAMITAMQQSIERGPQTPSA
jgi:hypothetical protein